MIVGGVVSIIVNVAVVVDWLLDASDAVKITVAVPVWPQPSLKPLKLLVQVTAEQVSFAIAPPLLANHACKAAMFPAPSHWTVWLIANSVIVGGVVSIMFIVTVAWSHMIGDETLHIW